MLGWLWGNGGYWSWDRLLTNWRDVSDSATTSLDLVKVSLTTIGGIGGVGYLVIKYRERASAERTEAAAELERAEQKLLTAVQQLGSASPQVRISGVYSLADTADIYRGDYRQRVVDILCGYLRTKRGEWVTPTDAEDGDDKIYVSDDGAVESTILEVLARHLRKRREATEHHPEVVQEVQDEQLWCNCSIDLHGAILAERPNFHHATFNYGTDFGGAIFTQGAIFWGANFTQGAYFGNAIFAQRVIFWGASFTLDTDFGDATFTQEADFWAANFTQEANFGDANFTQEANFGGTTFTQEANFGDAIFSRRADFGGTTFTQDIDFGGTTFTQEADFRGVTFTQNADFQSAIFNVDYQESGDSITFPRSMLLDRITGLPQGARWAKFDENGNILRIIEDDSPDMATEGNESGGEDPTVQ
ncbi:pentapeptide repeat-containing protein [Actinomyces bowdenii]|uniref:pentapeptide repeat-containing protein n=1 Tax=Actinomyces bowdenii TaxID=131109 RepID=UPI00163ACB4C|nr:pentapeptide repeat-containing protein [Actinomyces bowdenii]